jgi:hypothetical protein
VKIKLVQDAAERFLKENSTTVLTAGGVVGTVATAVLSVRAGYKSAQIIQAETRVAQKSTNEGETIIVEGEELPLSTKVKLVWPQFVPPVLTGSATIGAIIMSHRMNAKKAAALAAAYGVAQGQLDEYKAKLAEKLGVQRTEKAKAEMADERMQNSKQTPTQVIIIGDNVLCYDQPTDRYFQSSMEKVRSAEAKANREILERGYYEASEFYIELGLEGTTWSDNVGWVAPFSLEYSHVPAPDGRPCLAIDFSKLPEPDFVRTHSRYSP